MSTNIYTVVVERDDAVDHEQAVADLEAIGTITAVQRDFKGE